MATTTLRRPEVGTALRRLQIAGAFLVIALAGLLVPRVLASAAPYEVSVPVQDAAGLYPGSDVMVAGARAGRVEAISLEKGAALVRMSIDQAQAPLHSDASVSVRPKSLLGERYLALDPGQAPGTLASGATMPATAVTSATTLEDVVNTFDAPTRDKLQTLIVELGDGVAGRGQELNGGLAAGRQDLDSLQGIASTLASRDAELKTVIADLSSVTDELARSDRTQQLGTLIQNLEALLGNLASQEQQLQAVLTEANAALTRTANGLDGTGGNLAGVVRQVPVTVHLADLLMVDLGADTDTLMPHRGELNQGILEGPSVFGGRDANGFATRIAPIVSCTTVTLCPQLGGSGSPTDFLMGRPAQP